MYTGICQPGFVSKNAVAPCYPCPRGSYQPEVGMSSCFLCPGGSTTPERNSTHALLCEGEYLHHKIINC